jgi:CRP/FNR family transcriptional regulator, dissimilatory nitrate respiration regulator
MTSQCAIVAVALPALPEPARKDVRTLTAAKGEALFVRGEMPRAMYFVVSGEIQLVRRSTGGAEIVLQRARHGFLAEASLGQKGYHCDAVASVRSQVLAVPNRVFNEALSGEPFRLFWMHHLTRELRKVRAQAERLSLRTTRERIVHFIESEGENGEAALLQPMKSWAVELGVTHEALYRTVAKMKRDGEIEVSAGSVRLIARVT